MIKRIEFADEIWNDEPKEELLKEDYATPFQPASGTKPMRPI